MARVASIAFDNHYRRRAQACIAQGALTNSKRPTCLVDGVYPTHAKRGQGCFIFDTHGRKYVDFICGLGTNLFGYGNPEILSDTIAAMRDGLCLSLSSDLELDFAEKLKECFSFIDHMKILKTGTEACAASLKIARAATGRSLILSEGYHGWVDEFVALTPPALGCRVNTAMQKLTDLSQITKEVAAVIVEPVMLDNSITRIEWLRALKAKCVETGALLIFDEIITGMRYLKRGVSNQYYIEPDLICLGKALGNGMPISVVAGKKHVMECGEYFVSGTFGGERASLAAGLKVMELLHTKHLIEDLWRAGESFLRRFNSIWPEALIIRGYPTRGAFEGDVMVKALFWQECCKAGILFGPSWFFNFNHIEHSDSILNTCGDIMIRVKSGSVRLEGALPTTPFAAKQREK